MKNYSKDIFLVIFCILTLLIMICCQRKSEAWERINMAETVMNSQPDSALSILNSIETGSLDGKKEKARYSLLKSMALDKNYVDTTVFDVLQPAIDYYAKNGLVDERLRTCYYQGRIYQNQGENDSAMYCFLRGRELFAQAKDTMTIANLMVAQATLEYRMYKFDDYIRNNVEAARLYGESGRQDYEVSCLANALDVSVINDNKAQADSILSLINEVTEKAPYYNDFLIPYRLDYILQYGEKKELMDIVRYYSSQDSIDDMDKINIATAYYRLGDGKTAKGYLESINPDSEERNSLKYLAVKTNVDELTGDYASALESYRDFSALIDSIHMNIMSRDLLFAKKKHEMEKNNLIELHNRDRRVWVAICVAFILLLAVIFIYYRYNLLKAKRNLAEQERLSLLQANERLDLERKNSILAKEAAEYERDKRTLEAENLKMKIEQLEKERMHLKEVFEERKDLEKPLQDIIKTRMEMLNTLLAAEISKNVKYSKSYMKWQDDLIKDKDNFMKSTRLAFKGLYPKFMDYLESRGLTESEINYLCLYAIGLRGTEVGEYIKIKRHYHISSDIRKKLGIDEHETNIGLYVRKLMKTL